MTTSKNCSHLVLGTRHSTADMTQTTDGTTLSIICIYALLTKREGTMAEYWPGSIPSTIKTQKMKEANIQSS